MDLRQLTRQARHYIVTGGSRGIGYAVAEALAAEGASVALVARGPAAFDEARDRLTGAGHPVR